LILAKFSKKNIIFEVSATPFLLAPREVVPESISVKFDQLTMANDIQQQQQIILKAGKRVGDVYESDLGPLNLLPTESFSGSSSPHSCV
jgi:hypothetical protein